MVPATVCPAAAPVAGVTPERAGVVCRVMQLDREKDDGVDVTAGQLAIARAGGEGDVLLTVKSDPSSIVRFCCGDAIPVLDDAGGKVRDSYTYCPTWQAEKQRIAEGREQLKGGGLAPEPDPPVAHFDDGRGNVREAPAGSTYDDPDPWARARRDLDVLVPQETR